MSVDQLKIGSLYSLPAQKLGIYWFNMRGSKIDLGKHLIFPGNTTLMYVGVDSVLGISWIFLHVVMKERVMTYNANIASYLREIA